MKIAPADLRPSITPAASERKQAVPQPAGGEPSAHVELSGQAALHGESAGAAEFDRAKVERIALAIREGRFQIDADAIADKLIANARELLDKPGH